MRGALGLMSRALLVIIVLAGIALIGHLYVAGLLSQKQLGLAVTDLARQTEAVARRLMRSHKFLAALAFVAGTGAGWIAALHWMGHRIRHRPLIIADLRHADMPFADGVRHVRINAVPPVEDDAAATWLILQEAGRGRLTLWRRASADTLWRIPARHIRAATRLAGAAVATWSTAPWQAFVLLGTEVEQLWPSRHDLRIAPSSSTTLSAGR